jgi:hypothetical protein
MRHLVLALTVTVSLTSSAGQAQNPTSTTTAQPAARPQRTEADARARADANRKEREAQRVKTGAPVELIPDYVKANIGPVPDHRVNGDSREKHLFVLLRLLRYLCGETPASL